MKDRRGIIGEIPREYSSGFALLSEKKTDQDEGGGGGRNKNIRDWELWVVVSQYGGTLSVLSKKADNYEKS